MIKKIYTIMFVNIHSHRYKILALIILLTPTLAISQVWKLKQCLDTAMINNKNLQMSKNWIIIGDQKHKEAIANLIPKLNVTADYRYNIELPYQLMPAAVFGGTAGTFKEAQFGVPHNVNASLQLMAPLYNPQIYGAIETTRIAYEITELQYQKTEEQVYFDVCNLYYNAQILNYQLRFIDSNLINSNKLLKNIELLKENLLARNTDVNKVRLQVELLNTQKEVILNKYHQVVNALKFSIGIPFDYNIQIDDNITLPNGNDYISFTTIDIRIAETQKKLVSSELNTLQSSRLPTLSLYATYGQNGYGYDKKPNDFLKFYPISFAGIQLSFPLFSGTVIRRKINQKKVELQNSNLQLSLISEQNRMLTENSTSQKNVANKTIITTHNQISLAQEVYEQTLLQQSEGVASLTDVILADNSLREAQQSYLSSIIEYLKADLELKKLTGNISFNNQKNK